MAATEGAAGAGAAPAGSPADAGEAVGENAASRTGAAVVVRDDCVFRSAAGTAARVVLPPAPSRPSRAGVFDDGAAAKASAACAPSDAGAGAACGSTRAGGGATGVCTALLCDAADSRRAVADCE